MTEARGYNLQQLQPVVLHTFANASCPFAFKLACHSYVMACVDCVKKLSM